ncbi:hypothetical protein SAMN05444487_111142 [Marininema mesophilum]|uniref:Uncharacterized protein n=1 Tax=Marininema mesophilum TaxID=1048340 RepID=A0A1H2ZNV8_9BACL|nr:hypothetical protein [Marininema mesophilum]SDX18951.1 hypothetical protein SAMN05444487_111142 [Marininema mesophilum]
MKNIRRFLPYATAFALFATVATPAAFASGSDLDGAKQLETKGQKGVKTVFVPKGANAKDAVEVEIEKAKGKTVLVTKGKKVVKTVLASKEVKKYKEAVKIGKAQGKTVLVTKGKKGLKTVLVSKEAKFSNDAVKFEKTQRN